MKKIKKILYALITLSILGFGSALMAMESTGYVDVKKLFLYGKSAQFFLSKSCSSNGVNLSKGYYSLSSTKVDVNLYYSTLLTAFTTGKKVSVGYEPNAGNTACEVLKLEVQ